MRALCVPLLVPTALAALARPGAGQCPGPTLLPGNGGETDRYGSALVLSGDFAAVSSLHDKGPAGGRGTVYLYARGPAGWQELQQLSPPPKTTKSFFGVDLALSGTRLLVGSYRHVAISGPAFLFERGPTGWDFVTTLDVDEKTPYDVYGFRVDVDGETAVVSRTKDPTIHFEAGSVYVFERQGPKKWTRTAKLVASDPEPEARFGHDVHLQGDTLVIGAYWHGPAQTGKVYVFERTPAGWVETQTLEEAQVGEQDWYGGQIAIDGERMLVGRMEGAYGPGTVFVYERDAGGTWARTAALRASDGALDDRFGFSLDLVGERAVVGAPEDDNAQGLNAGALYVFELLGGEWTQTAKITSAQTHANDQLGVWLDISGTTLLASAPLSDLEHADTGAAFFFDLPDGVQGYCFPAACPCGAGDGTAGCPGSTGRGARLAACGSASAGVDDLVLGVSDLPPGQPVALLVGSSRRDLPFGDGRACVGGQGVGLFRFPPQASDAAGAAAFGPGLVAHSQAHFGAGAIDAGETWHFQGWYRDPGGPCGGGWNLSNGVSVTFTH